MSADTDRIWVSAKQLMLHNMCIIEYRPQHSNYANSFTYASLLADDRRAVYAISHLSTVCFRESLYDLLVCCFQQPVQQPLK